MADYQFVKIEPDGSGYSIYARYSESTSWQWVERASTHALAEAFAADIEGDYDKRCDYLEDH